MKIEITGEERDMVALLADAIARSRYSLGDDRLAEKVEAAILGHIEARVSGLINERLDAMVTKALDGLSASDILQSRLKGMLRKLMDG